MPSRKDFDDAFEAVESLYDVANTVIVSADLRNGKDLKNEDGLWNGLEMDDESFICGAEELSRELKNTEFRLKALQEWYERASPRIYKLGNVSAPSVHQCAFNFAHNVWLAVYSSLGYWVSRHHPQPPSYDSNGKNPHGPHWVPDDFIVSREWISFDAESPLYVGNWLPGTFEYLAELLRFDSDFKSELQLERTKAILECEKAGQIDEKREVFAEDARNYPNQIIVDVEKLVATVIDNRLGKKSDFNLDTKQAARWLRILASRPGEWITSKELQRFDCELIEVRTDRLKKKLPKPISDLIESNQRHGSRLNIFPG